MSKELPYIDENNQLHYEAYFGGNFRSFLRSSLPLDHPEHLYNYLQRHGIDWKLFFDESGIEKGTKLGPMDKLFGKMPKELTPNKYDEDDMEAAFNGGGANAAKLRVSHNKLTLPVLDFKQWLIKRDNDNALPGSTFNERVKPSKDFVYVEIADLSEKMFLYSSDHFVKGVKNFLNESSFKVWDQEDKSESGQRLGDFLDTAKMFDTWSSEIHLYTLKMIGVVYLTPEDK